MRTRSEENSDIIGIMQRGDAIAMEEYIRRDPNILNSPIDNDNNTLLHLAVNYYKPELVELLSRYKNLDTSITNAQGDTAKDICGSLKEILKGVADNTYDSNNLAQINQNIKTLTEMARTINTSKRAEPTLGEVIEQKKWIKKDGKKIAKKLKGMAAESVVGLTDHGIRDMAKAFDELKPTSKDYNKNLRALVEGFDTFTKKNRQTINENENILTATRQLYENLQPLRPQILANFMREIKNDPVKNINHAKLTIDKIDEFYKAHKQTIEAMPFARLFHDLKNDSNALITAHVIGFKNEFTEDIMNNPKVAKELIDKFQKENAPYLAENQYARRQLTELKTEIRRRNPEYRTTQSTGAVASNTQGMNADMRHTISAPEMRDGAQTSRPVSREETKQYFVELNTIMTNDKLDAKSKKDAIVMLMLQFPNISKDKSSAARIQTDNFLKDLAGTKAPDLAPAMSSKGRTSFTSMFKRSSGSASPSPSATPSPTSSPPSRTPSPPVPDEKPAPESTTPSFRRK